MMADHINIRHPDEAERGWRHMEMVKLLETKLEIANQRIEALEKDLDAIFTRARRGDEVWLYKGDLKIVVKPVEIEKDDDA